MDRPPRGAARLDPGSPRKRPTHSRGGDRRQPARIKGAAQRANLRQEIARQRLAKEAALAANRAKSRQIADVSHELRTPLNGVLGLLELVLERELVGEDRRRIEWAHGSAEALLILVEDLLDLERIEAGRFELRPRPFDLRELLLNVERLIGPAPTARDWLSNSTSTVRSPSA